MKKDIINAIFNEKTIKFLFVVLFVGSLHWILTQLYYYLCVGSGVWGFITSFISLGSPVCQFINYCQYELSKHYITVWTASAVSLIGWLVIKLT